MSDEEQPKRTIPMLAATNMLRPPPARIGKIGKDFTLPRSVPVKNVIGAAIGVLVLTPFFAVLLRSFTGILIGMAAGGFLGVLAVTWSPIKGESLIKWVSLETESRRTDRVVIGGRKVRAYIGLAPLHWNAAGRVELRPGAVEVHPGSYDDRGVLIPREEQLRQLRGDSAPFPGV